MDTAILAGIVSSIVGGLIAIVTAFFSSSFYAKQTKAELQTEFESRYNTKKWEVYTEFGSLANDVFASVKAKSTAKSMPVFSNKLLTIAGDLWIVGSSAVIQSYITWQVHNAQVAQGNRENLNNENLFLFAEIVIQMRRDLGYQSDQVTARDLLAVYIPEFAKTT